MRDNPESHDFDWVTARDLCSLPKEFHRLKELVEENYKTRKRCMPPRHPYAYTFCAIDSDNFSVQRTDPPNESCAVQFSLKNDRIIVGGSNSVSHWDMTLTLTLNNAGECRFKIDGDGEYLRWQAAMKALGPLFFERE